MTTTSIEIGSIGYDARKRRYEALVTVHDGKNTRRYPCAVTGCLAMSHTATAGGFARQALKMHRNPRPVLPF